MVKSNGDFIYKCRLCGKTDIVMSELTLKANYGSSYDGEVLEVDLCGNCADRVFEQLSNEREVR